MVSLALTPEAKTSTGAGVSADGLIIVGTTSPSASGGATCWTQFTGMMTIGELPGGQIRSAAHAISGNGQIIVGESSSAMGIRSEAFRWTVAEGMVGLGDLPGGTFDSIAWAVSSNGAVVVGCSQSAQGNEAFRWTQTTGMVPLSDLPGGDFSSIAYGVSSDGSVVVGRGYSGAFNNPGTHEAFRWTAQSGMVPLGFAPGDHDSVAYAVSADGNTIVGDNPYPSPGYALIWDPQHGMRHLQDALAADYGLDLTGWRLLSARDITSDGTVIVCNVMNSAGKYESMLINLKPSVPIAPSLEISRAAEHLIISWETNAPDFTLEQTLALDPKASWNLVSGQSPIVGSQYKVIIGITNSQGFFRLQHH